MDITGTILEIFDTVNVSASFRKREFVVEYIENPQYPEVVKFELIQDKCELLDSLSVGQQVQTFFNLKGRKWINPKGESVYFNSLQAWKLIDLADKPTKSQNLDGGGPPPYNEPPADNNNTQEEALPF